MNRKNKFRKKRHNTYLIIVFVLLALFVAFYWGYTSFGNNLNNIPEHTPSSPLPTSTRIISSPSAVVSTNTPVPSATPTPGPKATASKTPSAAPSPHTGPFVHINKSDIVPECVVESFNGFSSDILLEDKNANNYICDNPVSFSNDQYYSSVEGITTFRGNNYRNSAAYGQTDITGEKLEKVWFATTGYIDEWTGVGWSGQPAIVKWDDDIKHIMNIYPEKKQKDNLKEVIYGTLDGKIYFIDLEDGQETRPPIDIGFPVKGSVTIDPRGYPLLYIGQGIPTNGETKGPIGFRIFSLIDQSLLKFYDGLEPAVYRGWGAFDSAALVDAKTDTLIVCGENGLVYRISLNTDFDIEKGILSINPKTVKYRYRSPYGYKIGVENSPAIYKNLIYFADNSGLLQCIDLNTMKPVWLRNVSDDTDSSIVLEAVSDNEVYIYTACELELQGPDGKCYIRKIDAFTGNLIWEKEIAVFYSLASNGGAFATPVLGRNDIDNLIIFNISKTGKNNNKSTLFALDRLSGDEVWSFETDYYSWSSPVAVYTPAGKSYLLFCDGGYMRLLDGKTGALLYSIGLEANIEASPAVYGNIAVVGTRGQKIWGIKIK